MPEIAVVILNWNTRNFLEKFLPDVIRFSGDAEIIVADNFSKDDSVNFVATHFPSVRIIRNKTNEGFTGGYNTALSQVESKYFLLLNSDVQVSENWLVPLKKLMDENETAGACQPKILSHAYPSLFEYAGAAGGFIDKYGYPFCRGRIFNSIEEDLHQYDSVQNVFWATGACMMIRSEVFRKMNGFDNNFFAHMEEIDICWRMQLAGFTVHVCPQSVVYHVGGGTLHKSNPHKTFLNFRNNLLMLHKNLDASRLKKVFRIRYFLDYFAATVFFLQGNIKDSKAIFRAHKEFRILKHQYPRNIQKVPTQTDTARHFIYRRSILLDYYLYRRKKFSELKWPGKTRF